MLSTALTHNLSDVMRRPIPLYGARPGLGLIWHSTPGVWTTRFSVHVKPALFAALNFKVQKLS
jgi:hypothetical protein